MAGLSVYVQHIFSIYTDVAVGSYMHVLYEHKYNVISLITVVTDQYSSEMFCRSNWLLCALAVGACLPAFIRFGIFFWNSFKMSNVRS